MTASAISTRQLTPLVSRLDIDNACASASISLWGGQVLSFRPRHDARERLYLSTRNCFDGSIRIRGGIPVCWPWFGVHEADAQFPVHGYASTRLWHVLETAQGGGHTRVLLQLADPQGNGFRGTASLRLEVLVGKTLTLNLVTTNTGNMPLRFTSALHSYFAVNDVRQVQLTGLAGRYLDNTQDLLARETPAPYCLSEATDRIHLHAAPWVKLVEPRYTTLVRSGGHDSIVVWDPWQSGAAELADMDKDDWMRMLCIETAATRGIELAPGQTHCLSQTIE